MTHATLLYLLLLFPSCELVEASRNIKDGSRLIQEQTAKLATALHEHEATSRTLDVSIARLDKMTEQAAAAWDRWVMPGVMVLGFGVLAWARTRETKPG